MKGVFGVEAISLSASKRATYGRLALEREMYRHWRPWCAELLGPDVSYGYEREFLDPKVDYSQANSTGSRGVRFFWTLESGRFYETRYPVTWQRREHKFLTVSTDGYVVEIAEGEIRARWEEREVRARWAASADLGSMF